MEEESSRFDKWWDSRPAPAIILVLIGLGITTWAYFVPMSPGKAIGALAAVAGIMSLRPKMKFPEKLAWIVILTTLAVLEFAAIDRTDRDNLKSKTDLNTQLQGIQAGIDISARELNVVSIGIASMAKNQLPIEKHTAQPKPVPSNGKRTISAEKLGLDLKDKETSSATVVDDGTNEAGNFANQLVIGLRDAGWVVGGNNIKIGDPAFFPDSLTVEVSAKPAAPNDHSVAEAKTLIAALKKQGVSATLRFTEQAFPANFMRIKVAGM